MNPQDKAKELVERFSKIELGETAEGLPFYMPISEAKQCALIAVDEILDEVQHELGPKEIRLYLNAYWNGEKYLAHLDWVIYWQQVKQEIEKL